MEENYINLQQKYLANKSSIDTYTKRLADSDYKIIKCYEYSLVNEPMPYDVTALHEEREKLRTLIRQCEENLKKL